MKIGNTWIKLDNKKCKIQNQSGYNIPIFITFSANIPNETTNGLMLENKNIINLNCPDNMYIYVKGSEQNSKIFIIEEKPDTNGLSAYELAVSSGFNGNQDEWLLSLKGDIGSPGKDGVTINTNDNTQVQIWIGTQSEYDLITTKDPDTLYMIKEGV